MKIYTSDWAFLGVDVVKRNLNGAFFYEIPDQDIPRAVRFVPRITWFTKSKAVLKSKKSKPKSCPMSISRIDMLTVIRQFVNQKFPFMKPC